MATTVVEPAFVDTNVLVYANQSHAARHAQALALLREADEAGAALAISGQVLREYLAVVTRPQAGSAPLPMAAALDRVALFTRRFHLLQDGPIVRARLHDLLAVHPGGGRQVHDANIVATMLAHRVRRLLTFNTADFRRFRPLIEIAQDEA